MSPNSPLPSILVVDDETMVRAVAVEMLSGKGFTACEAGDADEALFMLAAYPSIAVVFTDISMPGSMDGVGLALRVRELRSDVGIIMTSGKSRVLESAIPDGEAFLAKPYSPEQLVAAVEQKISRAA